VAVVYLPLLNVKVGRRELELSLYTTNFVHFLYVGVHHSESIGVHTEMRVSCTFLSLQNKEIKLHIHNVF